MLTNEEAKCTGSGKTCNFWVQDTKYVELHGFTMDLGCTKHVTGIRIRNAQWTDRDNPGQYVGVKEFRLKGALEPTGPWSFLIKGSLPDTKPGLPKPEVVTMWSDQEQVARYIMDQE